MASISSTSTFFIEREEFLGLIGGLKEGEDNEKSVERLKTILDRYLESPTLLDPHLEEIMSSLVTPSSSMIHSLYSSGTISDDLSNTPTNEGPPLLHTYLSLISHLSKVRGYKTIKKLFTHEAVDLEPTLMCLLSQDPQNHALWESRYALLLWLSMLALVPFDICTIDSTSESSTRTTSNLVETIIKISKSYLSDPGPVRESAAVCLSSVLTRPDMEEGYLQDFMEYSKEVLMIRVGIKKNDGDDGKSNTVSHLTDNTFLTMGLVHTLAHLFKYGHREKFLIYVDAFLEQIILLAENGGSQTMLRKLLVKLFQRVGTTFMPVRIVPWRYQRGRRSLLTNMESKGEGKEELTESEVTEEPDIYVPPELEDVVDQLLTGLRDRDTVVRWSAAKGLGRITERLPRECADDVVGAIMELFNDNETDSAWHGANLALAELARRGLLLPSRLPKVVPIIVRAIHYDVRRGQNSVGAHVRDAACYVCWAFARAYSPEVMKPYVEELAKGMLLAALFDREINCRRAASAAFQENVGRQGNENFKHGIEILTAADYFTLGNRVKAFTEISCFVAGFEKYRRSVIGHLKEVKLFHWDVEIRLLASQGLGNLVALDKNYMADVVLHELISKVCDPDLLVRHGAVLGIAEIVKALKSNVSSKHAEIANVVVEVEKARLYRGKGGEIMRSAICRLIECVSIAQLPLPVKTQVRLLDSVDDCIKHPLEEISLSAVAGLRALLKQYFPVASTGPSSRLHSRVFQKYAKVVEEEDNAAATRGFALAIGCLPAKLLAFNDEALETAVNLLCKCADINFKVGEEPDAETRRNCVKGLTEIVKTVGVGSTKIQTFPGTDKATLTSVGLSLPLTTKIFATLFSCMEDYSMDKRGDVGSWVRCAALNALETLTLEAVDASKNLKEASPDPTSAANKDDEDENEILPPLAERMQLLDEDIQAKVLASVQSSSPMNEEWRSVDTPPQYFDVQTSITVLGLILKQLAEKLDNVRDLAGNILHRLLNENKIPLVADRVFLTEALKTKANETMNWASPHTTFTMIIKAMNIDVYHEAIVEGLAVSVGGLTESVVKSSSGALIDWVKTMKKLKGWRHLARLGRTLINLMRKFEKDERIVVPVLKTVHLLLQNEALRSEERRTAKENKTEETEEEKDRFGPTMLKLVKAEAHGSKSYKKIVAIVDVLIDLTAEIEWSGADDEDKAYFDEVLTFAFALLGHPFPKVRKYVAEQLYVAILENEGAVKDDSKYDNACSVILETAWDGELEQTEEQEVAVRVRRNELADLMGVELSEKARAKKVVKKGKEKEKKDELASYMSLVKEAGR